MVLLVCDQTGAVCVDAEIISQYVQEHVMEIWPKVVPKGEGKGFPRTMFVRLWATWPNPPPPRYWAYCTSCDSEQLMWAVDLFSGHLVCRPCYRRPDSLREINDLLWLEAAQQEPPQ